MAQLCLWVVLLLLPAAVRAQFTFTTNNGTAIITGYTGSNGIVTIPSSVIGLPVTQIGIRAFDSAKVTNVLIPDSVINIGTEAFFNCQSLTNVTVGNSATSVGDRAFGSCPKLKSVCCRGNAPGLHGGNVFFRDPATIYYLQGATGWQPVFGGRPAVLWNPVVPYNYITNNSTVEITGYTSSNNSATIPSTIDFLPVTAIDEWAFRFSTVLTNITIPDSVITIGDEVFVGSGLSSIIIPDSVTSIGNGAFGWCGLPSLTIPDSVTNLGYDVCYMSGLTNAVIGNGVSSIPEEAFAFCYSLVSVKFGTNITSMGMGAFEQSGLTCIAIPSSVTSIGDDTFINCYSLTSAIIPNSVTNLGDWAFAYCSSMTNISIGNQVPLIGSGTFSGTRLTNITFPASVTRVEGQTFQYCGRLAVYFKGNAPNFDPNDFDNTATVYYLPGTTGWDTTFSGQPTALWLPQMQTVSPAPGGQTNPFSFNINWANGQTVVVEACTNLFNPGWQPLQTNLLTTGPACFSDAQWTNYPARYYRLRSP